MAEQLITEKRKALDFTVIKRKRKSVQSMEVGDEDACSEKRPSFPPAAHRLDSEGVSN